MPRQIPPSTPGGLANLFPLRHRPRVLEILGRLGYTPRRWLIGQLLTMILIGVSTMLVLWAFGVPLAIILGLIVGLLGFIPYLGPILGLVPVALLAATKGLNRGRRELVLPGLPTDRRRAVEWAHAADSVR